MAFLILWLAINLADVWTTHRALATNPHAGEGNPLMAQLQRLGGEPLMHGFKLTVAGGAAWLAWSYDAEWLLLIPGAVIARAVFSNLKFIKKG